MRNIYAQGWLNKKVFTPVHKSVRGTRGELLLRLHQQQYNKSTSNKLNTSLEELIPGIKVLKQISYGKLYTLPKHQIHNLANLSGELSDLQNYLEATHRLQLDPAIELACLRRDFNAQCYIQETELVISLDTPRIFMQLDLPDIITEIDMGTYNIEIRLDDVVSNLTNQKPDEETAHLALNQLKVISNADSSLPTVNTQVKIGCQHPHILGNGKICLGEHGTALVHKYIREYRLYDVVMTIIAVLQTLNTGDTHAPLHKFLGFTTCQACGGIIPGNQRELEALSETLEKLDIIPEKLTDNQSTSCSICEAAGCTQCHMQCASCGYFICSKHTLITEDYDVLCTRCSEICPECGQVVRREDLIDGVCKDCAPQCAFCDNKSVFQNRCNTCTQIFTMCHTCKTAEFERINTCNRCYIWMCPECREKYRLEGQPLLCPTCQPR